LTDPKTKSTFLLWFGRANNDDNKQSSLLAYENWLIIGLLSLFYPHRHKTLSVRLQRT